MKEQHKTDISMEWNNLTVLKCHIALKVLVYFNVNSRIVYLLHDRCKKGRGMCYPVCGMMLIKEPLLLIGKSSPCGGSRFPLLLSEWSFTICLTPYNRKLKCVKCVVK